MPVAYDSPEAQQDRRKKEERDTYVSSLQTYKSLPEGQYQHGQRARLEGFGRIPSGWRAVPEYSTRGSTVVEYYPGGFKTADEYHSEAMGRVPDPPELQHYTGPTANPLTPRMEELLDYTGGLISDPQSPYRSLIDREPNEQDVQTLVNQARREFEEYTLPGIVDSFSGTPYGSGVTSGAARAAESGARVGFGESVQGLRISERQRADQNALQALGLLPAIANPFYVEMQNQVDNLNRDIEVHYKNTDVDIAAYQQTLNEFSAAMDLASFNFDVQSYNEEMEMQKKMIEEQKKASKSGLFGSIAGMVLGFALPGIGLAASAGLGTAAATTATIGTRMLGAQLGSSIGGTIGTALGGGNPTAFMAGGGASSVGSDLARNYYMSQLIGKFGSPGSGGGGYGSGYGSLPGSVGGLNAPRAQNTWDQYNNPAANPHDFRRSSLYLR